MNVDRLRRLAATVAALLTVSGVALAAPQIDQVVVGFADGAAIGDLDAGRVVDDLTELAMAVVEVTPAQRVALEGDSDLVFVSDDRTLAPTGAGFRGGLGGEGGSASANAPHLWRQGLTGRGQTVAVVDTGVSNHPDLAGRVIHGANFAGDGTTADRFGHGTVMAGLIAGNGAASAGLYTGVAPEARIVSVKVAGANGATDVSQVLAGLQWAVSHRATYNIGVLAIAYGNDSAQSGTVDPLAFAVQRASDAGIVVVASAGNSGPARGTVTSPGTAAAAVTVGAFDPATKSAADFSGVGPTVDGIRKPDFVFTGVNVISPVDITSTIAATFPDALRPGGYIRGSGSSQATALAAGVAALVRQAAPTDSVDQVRNRLVLAAAAGKSAGGDPQAVGAGLLETKQLDLASRVAGLAPALRGTGLGSLEAARGSYRVEVNGAVVQGEVTAAGDVWDAATWTGSNWTGSNWTGSLWTGSNWTGSNWTGSNWTGSNWTGSNWTGSNWTGSLWTGNGWG